MQTEVAPGVWQLGAFPAHAINQYLINDVLVDCGTRWAYKRLIRQLHKRPPSLIALTHCHPDHQGSAKAVCAAFQVPLACHELDTQAMEGREPMEPRNNWLKWSNRVWGGPPRPVDRFLRDGDDVAGFRVVHAPGHTRGHVMFFRESDRVLIAGDVLANIHFLTGATGLRVPPRKFCVDSEENYRSIQLLATLRPALVCFGHGPPCRDSDRLQSFVEILAARVSDPLRP